MRKKKLHKLKRKENVMTQEQWNEFISGKNECEICRYYYNDINVIEIHHQSFLVCKGCKNVEESGKGITDCT